MEVESQRRKGKGATHTIRGHDLGRIPARRMHLYAVHAAGFDLAATSNSADRAVDAGAER